MALIETSVANAVMTITLADEERRTLSAANSPTNWLTLLLRPTVIPM